MGVNMLKSLSLIAILLFTVSGAQAGSIQGEIIFSGEVPAPKTIKTGKFSKVCGPLIHSDALLVDNKRVKNAVIWLSGRGAKKLKAHSGEFPFDQKNVNMPPMS